MHRQSVAAKQFRAKDCSCCRPQAGDTKNELSFLTRSSAIIIINIIGKHRAGGVTTPARYETAILITVLTSASPPRIGTLSVPQPFFCEKYLFFVFFLCRQLCRQLSASCLPVVLQLSPSCFAKTTGRPRVLVQKDQAKQKKFPEYEILKSKFLEK